MSIDWLEVEEILDDEAQLADRKERAELRLKHNAEDREAWLELLDVIDQQAEKSLGDQYASEGWSAANSAFQQNIDDAILRAWCSRFALRTGDITLALHEAAEAMKSDPREPIARIVRAQVFMQAGRFNEALSDIDVGAGDIRSRIGSKDVEPRPTDERFLEELLRLQIVCLARTKRYNEALQIQRKRYESQPDTVQVIIDYAELLELTGDVAKSASVLNEAIKTHPANIDLLTHTASRHYERSDFAQGIELADRVLELDPQHLETWHFRAQCCFQQGDYQRALEDHSMIGELSKSIPIDAGFIATCYEKMGKKDEAIAALEKGLKDSRNGMDRILALRKQLADLSERISGGASKNLGPNDPCWCGSGKKLKKCHRVSRA